VALGGENGRSTSAMKYQNDNGDGGMVTTWAAGAVA